MVDAPPGTTLAGANLTRRVVVAAAGYGYQLRETAAGGASPKDIQLCTTVAACAATAKTPSISWRAARPGVVRLDFRVFCRPTTDVPCAVTKIPEAASVRVTQADLTFADAAVPVVAAPTGSLVSGGQPVTGVREIDASAIATRRPNVRGPMPMSISITPPGVRSIVQLPPEPLARTQS